MLFLIRWSCLYWVCPHHTLDAPSGAVSRLWGQLPSGGGARYCLKPLEHLTVEHLTGPWFPPAAKSFLNSLCFLGLGSFVGKWVLKNQYVIMCISDISYETLIIRPLQLLHLVSNQVQLSRPVHGLPLHLSTFKYFIRISTSTSPFAFLYYESPISFLLPLSPPYLHTSSSSR